MINTQDTLTSHQTMYRPKTTLHLNNGQGNKRKIRLVKWKNKNVIFRIFLYHLWQKQSPTRGSPRIPGLYNNLIPIDDINSKNFKRNLITDFLHPNNQQEIMRNSKNIYQTKQQHHNKYQYFIDNDKKQKPKTRAVTSHDKKKQLDFFFSKKGSKAKKIQKVNYKLPWKKAKMHQTYYK